MTKSVFFLKKNLLIFYNHLHMYEILSFFKGQNYYYLLLNRHKKYEAAAGVVIKGKHYKMMQYSK